MEVAIERTREMDEAQVKLWNETVPRKDSTVIVCGDFCWRDPDRWLGRLHGKKILCVGNHDKKGLLSDKRSFSEVWQRLERVFDGKLVICDHYPLASWRSSVHGSWHFHSHCHCRMRRVPGLLRFDVGVDGHGYEPWPWTELHAIMEQEETTRRQMIVSGAFPTLIEGEDLKEETET
jgi:calcineurin-like phosphoesterase family protein